MGFSHFHGRFSNPSPFKGEVRRGMGYICRCSIKPFEVTLCVRLFLYQGGLGLGCLSLKDPVRTVY